LRRARATVTPRTFPAMIVVKAIREKARMSQEEFARR
jgi:DNA-binding transcriptional regulator YiaG